MLVDLALARRLERAEGCACADFVDARAGVSPGSGAQWIEVGGTYAMFDGVDSPITQTFGLGLFDTPAADHLERIERFFEEKGAKVHHEVSPLAEKSLWPLLGERGYFPIEFTSVLFQELPWRGTAGAVSVRVVGPGEKAWVRTFAEGWSLSADDKGLMELAEISAQRKGAICFLAEIGGEPVGSAALCLHDGVALLAGASTIPRHRGKGAQGALLAARLDYASERGCDVAMMGAEPGSSSQRNAERQGFRIAYTRIKWERRKP